ncbi:hypothetical protein IG631_08301 [Alternaria alternata]|nr:hypothetical protein IG631_08301 [Alternaria alternata]
MPFPVAQRFADDDGVAAPSQINEPRSNHVGSTDRSVSHAEPRRKPTNLTSSDFQTISHCSWLRQLRSHASAHAHFGSASSDFSSVPHSRSFGLASELPCAAGP